jgi:hypothetical protein
MPSELDRLNFPRMTVSPEAGVGQAAWLERVGS